MPAAHVVETVAYLLLVAGAMASLLAMLAGMSIGIPNVLVKAAGSELRVFFYPLMAMVIGFGILSFTQPAFSSLAALGFLAALYLWHPAKNRWAVWLGGVVMLGGLFYASGALGN